MSMAQARVACIVNCMCSAWKPVVHPKLSLGNFRIFSLNLTFGSYMHVAIFKGYIIIRVINNSIEPLNN